MKAAFVFVVFVLASSIFVNAREKFSDDSLRTIRFEQRLNQQTSPDLPFLDESGRVTTMNKCIDGKPTILVLGYYGCPMLCTLVLNGLVETLQELKSSPGEKLSVVCVSIDAREKPQLAAAKKASCLKRYGRANTADGWHFLTGNDESIRKIAEQIGFNYAFDSASGQFAHPSGFVVLTPRGKVAKYFFGVGFSPNDLNAALKDAAEEKSGSAIREFLFLCFRYNPIKGKYGDVIMTTVRISGVVSVVALVGGIFVMRRREKTSRSVVVVGQPPSAVIVRQAPPLAASDELDSAGEGACQTKTDEGVHPTSTRNK